MRAVWRIEAGILQARRVKGPGASGQGGFRLGVYKVGYEVAPRTKHLMTEGPYRISRNPMLSGTYLYYIGIVVALWNWCALAIFVVVAALMMFQVCSEEKRLEADFGEEYLKYKKRTGRFFTFKW